MAGILAEVVTEVDVGDQDSCLLSLLFTYFRAMVASIVFNSYTPMTIILTLPLHST